MAYSLQNIAIKELKGVGNALSTKLAKLSLYSVEDLLFHLPIRYQNRTRVTPIAGLMLGNEVMIYGEITNVQIINRPKRSLQVSLQDSSGQVRLRFFHFTQGQLSTFRKGQWLSCFGEPRRGRQGLEFYHPEYSHTPPSEQKTLTPVYPLTQGIAQARLRNLCDQALGYLQRAENLPDWLPETLRKHYQLMDLTQAIKLLHKPNANTDINALLTGSHPARYRLIFEELLSHHLSLLNLRQQVLKQNSYALAEPKKELKQFEKQLGFELTEAQKRVKEQISQNLQSSNPMLRLVQGDVGCGKTVIAAMAALQAVKNGYQCTLMVPTEILSRQHYKAFFQWFTPFNIACCQLTGKLKGKKRQEQLSRIKTGQEQMIIGTHALFQADIEFYKLGLVIIDEQHRFGVHQRLSLREKAETNKHPHQLIMTATPIPRTLAMSMYADLDISVIDQLPVGRKPIETLVVNQARREQIVEKINHYCQKGHQAYWVCTLIEESENLQCQAAQAIYATLCKTLPNLNCGLIHGRLKAKEKIEIMEAFKQNKIQLLVATTVIEVGVDVPNATLMVIENSERLGLAQLHQLRGRVGRGSEKSYSILLYQHPLSQIGRERLKALKNSNDGFYIAEQDLMLRGPGEVLGTRQTGLIDFKIADIVRDQDLLPKVKKAATWLEKENPDAVKPLLSRWLKERERYALA